MWIVLLVMLAAGLALSTLPEKRVRLAMIPIVMLVVAYEAATTGLL